MYINKNLSVLSFNTGLFRFTILKKSLWSPVAFAGGRRKHMPKAILENNADIVCLQEVCLKQDREFFIEKLSIKYPYHFHDPTPKLKFSSGLVVFSKLPLINPIFEPLNFSIWSEKMVINRGLIGFSVKSQLGNTVNIINSHTTVGGVIVHPASTFANGWRDLQIYQMLDFFDYNSPVIIAGDFNSGPQLSQINYNHLIRQGFIDTYDVLHTRQTPTWSKKNPLNKISPLYALEPSQKMDHIFIKNIPEEAVVDAVVTFTKTYSIRPLVKTPLSDHFAISCEIAF